ncbi:unnamed protein product [Amoebophrya sp. A120]|nr:unnamed protein product [Amoebophrya sp. A120]|eukprot:GSA120T00004681001.1
MLPEDLNPGNRDYKTVPLLSADEQNRNQEREGHNDLSGAASSSSRPARGNDTSDVGPSTSVASAANTHTSDDTRRTKQNTNTSKSGGNLFPVGGGSSAAGSSSSSSSSSNSSSSNREPPLDIRDPYSLLFSQTASTMPWVFHLQQPVEQDAALEDYVLEEIVEEESLAHTDSVAVVLDEQKTNLLRDIDGGEYSGTRTAGGAAPAGDQEPSAPSLQYDPFTLLTNQQSSLLVPASSFRAGQEQAHAPAGKGITNYFSPPFQLLERQMQPSDSQRETSEEDVARGGKRQAPGTTAAAFAGGTTTSITTSTQYHLLLEPPKDSVQSTTQQTTPSKQYRTVQMQHLDDNTLRLLETRAHDVLAEKHPEFEMDIDFRNDHREVDLQLQIVSDGGGEQVDHTSRGSTPRGGAGGGNKASFAYFPPPSTSSSRKFFVAGAPAGDSTSSRALLPAPTSSATPRGTSTSSTAMAAGGVVDDSSAVVGPTAAAPTGGATTTAAFVPHGTSSSSSTHQRRRTRSKDGAALHIDTSAMLTTSAGSHAGAPARGRGSSRAHGSSSVTRQLSSSPHGGSVVYAEKKTNFVDWVYAGVLSSWKAATSLSRASSPAPAGSPPESHTVVSPPGGPFAQIKSPAQQQQFAPSAADLQEQQSHHQGRIITTPSAPMPDHKPAVGPGAPPLYLGDPSSTAGDQTVTSKPAAQQSFDSTAAPDHMLPQHPSAFLTRANSSTSQQLAQHRDFSLLMQQNKLSKFAVMAIVFFNVSGGPWGSEEIFSDYGPLVGIIAVLVVSAIWSYPQILITSELSSAFPVNGGYSLWVTEAFGPFWGTMESYYSWVSGVVDNAVYPVLLFDGVKHYYSAPKTTSSHVSSTSSPAAAPASTTSSPSTTSFFGTTVTDIPNINDWSDEAQYACKLALVLLLAVPNVISTTGTGQFLQVLGVLQLLPFLAFLFITLVFHWGELDFSVLLEYRSKEAASSALSGTSSSALDSTMLHPASLLTTPGHAVQQVVTQLQQQEQQSQGSSMLFPQQMSSSASPAAVLQVVQGVTELQSSAFLTSASASQLLGGQEKRVPLQIQTTDQQHDASSYTSLSFLTSLFPSDLDISIFSPEDGLQPARFTDFLCVIYWNLSGWDCVSTIAGEMYKPEKNLKPALLYSLLLTILQYLVILSVAASCNILPWQDWKDGSLPEIVEAASSSFAAADNDNQSSSRLFSSRASWMGFFLLLASCFGNAGMFTAELMEDSYQLEGLTAADVIPRWTKMDYRHPKFDTPVVAMIPSLGFCIICIFFDFQSILAIDNCFASLAALLEILAFYSLRKNRPEMERGEAKIESPFALFVLIPIAFLFGCLVFVKSLLKGGGTSVVNLFLLVAGFPLAKLLATRFERLYL